MKASFPTLTVGKEAFTAGEPKSASSTLIVMQVTGTLDYRDAYTGTMEVRREGNDKYCISSMSLPPPPS